MNLNIPPDSQAWLFAPRRDEDECAIWSLGRWQPPCEMGDPIYFRFDKKIVARAIVYLIIPPGEHDFITHHKKRYCTGWKIVWAWETFEDLRHQPDTVAAIERQLRRARQKRSPNPESASSQPEPDHGKEADRF